MKTLKLSIVTYGLGNIFKPELFKPIKNRQFCKPEGGLWSSPKESNWGWRDWCNTNEWGDLDSKFELLYIGNTIIISKLSDLKKLIIQPGWDKKYFFYPDFEAMLKIEIDGIFLTEQGQEETHLSNPGLYGWDCECLLIMNQKCIHIP